MANVRSCGPNFSVTLAAPCTSLRCWGELFDDARVHPYFPDQFEHVHSRRGTMKVRNSLKSLRSRHRNNRLVRRKGRVYVINKLQRRFKARQG